MYGFIWLWIINMYKKKLIISDLFFFFVLFIQYICAQGFLSHQNGVGQYCEQFCLLHEFTTLKSTISVQWLHISHVLSLFSIKRFMTDAAEQLVHFLHKAMLFAIIYCLQFVVEVAVIKAKHACKALWDILYIKRRILRYKFGRDWQDVSG